MALMPAAATPTGPDHLGLTLIAVTVVYYMFLRFAYISFFCFLAGLGTLHLIYIIVRNKCCRECPELFR